ncbi:MAG: tyrosine--tRNA ligase [Cytophagaceae bacterium]|jgi:tyrosyl-tRNA synthetase|nr:tyrosine--tRNA ligase [Cytophagaceae bacterium]
MQNFVEELKWRGMLHDVMPGTEQQLLKESTAGYVGFDPTSDSLTIGNMVSIMLLVHFQRAGHRPVALVGGATGMIGDPSGKSEERNLLSEEVLRHNQACIQKQLEKFLEFSGTNPASIVNNFDWIKEFSFISFLRDVGKHLSVNYMMAKDSVKKRLETGISYTEFTYQLIQGYDYLHLYKNHGCKLQMGGSDQWGNITTGTELIRRMAGGEAYALTCPLLTRADGTKMGKTAGGQTVWLDSKKTSPYQLYQYLFNMADSEVGKMLRIFTLMGKEEIEALEQSHALAPNERILQKRLGQEMVSLLHSATDYQASVRASEILFNGSLEELKTLGEDVLTSLETVGISRNEYEGLGNVTDLLALATNDKGTKIFPSKGEARKMIQQGGVSVNRGKLSAPDQKLEFDLLQNKYLLVQKGKKQYFLLEIK